MRFKLKACAAQQPAREVRQQEKMSERRTKDQPQTAIAKTGGILKRELGPPAVVKVRHECLLDNRPELDLAAAVQWIEQYRLCWEIEMIFHVLKSGCRVESSCTCRVMHGWHCIRSSLGASSAVDAIWGTPVRRSTPNCCYQP